jgi:hypothetical protein
MPSGGPGSAFLFGMFFFFGHDGFYVVELSILESLHRRCSKTRLAVGFDSPSKPRCTATQVTELPARWYDGGGLRASVYRGVRWINQRCRRKDLGDYGKQGVGVNMSGST